MYFRGNPHNIFFNFSKSFFKSSPNDHHYQCPRHNLSAFSSELQDNFKSLNHFETKDEGVFYNKTKTGECDLAKVISRHDIKDIIRVIFVQGHHLRRQDMARIFTLKQILPINTIRNIWKAARRISMLILGLNG